MVRACVVRVRPVGSNARHPDCSNTGRPFEDWLTAVEKKRVRPKCQRGTCLNLCRELCQRNFHWGGVLPGFCVVQMMSAAPPALNRNVFVVALRARCCLCPELCRLHDIAIWRSRSSSQGWPSSLARKCEARATRSTAPMCTNAPRRAARPKEGADQKSAWAPPSTHTPTALRGADPHSVDTPHRSPRAAATQPKSLGVDDGHAHARRWREQSNQTAWHRREHEHEDANEEDEGHHHSDVEAREGAVQPGEQDEGELACQHCCEHRVLWMCMHELAYAKQREHANEPTKTQEKANERDGKSTTKTQANGDTNTQESNNATRIHTIVMRFGRSSKRGQPLVCAISAAKRGRPKALVLLL